MFNAYLRSFSSQTATANRGVGRFDSLQKQQGLIEKSEQDSQCSIYWSAGASGGGATDVAGRLPSSANAIGWRCLCPMLWHELVFRLFSFCTWTLPTLKTLADQLQTAGNIEWRVHAVLQVYADAHITPLLPASAAMLKFTFIFLCPDESSDCTVHYNKWPHWSLTVVYLGQSYRFLFVLFEKIV